LTVGDLTSVQCWLSISETRMPGMAQQRRQQKQQQQQQNNNNNNNGMAQCRLDDTQRVLPSRILQASSQSKTGSYCQLHGCFLFVSTTVLTTTWVFIISHFATKPATVFKNTNKQETPALSASSGAWSLLPRGPWNLQDRCSFCRCCCCYCYSCWLLLLLWLLLCCTT
jgi:hypothetical protein